ncbi:hypothetical protein D3C80_1957460 [compost metagenome]
MPWVMPSEAMACMSAVLLITRLWPMTFFGSLPEWVSLTVNSLQLLSTVNSLLV